MNKITHVLCSPLARTLETALMCFQHLHKDGLKAIAWAPLIAGGDSPCNVGDPLPVLRKKIEGKPVELKYLTEGWELAENAVADTRLRARRVTKTLYKLCEVASRMGDHEGGRRDVEILVISHSLFLSELMCERESNHSHISQRRADQLQVRISRIVRSRPVSLLVARTSEKVPLATIYSRRRRVRPTHVLYGVGGRCTSCIDGTRTCLDCKAIIFWNYELNPWLNGKELMKRTLQQMGTR
jgi:hypothetical protein